jgi:predicted TIM-barrel fold metal-dependent hydrolase
MSLWFLLLGLIVMPLAIGTAGEDSRSLFSYPLKIDTHHHFVPDFYSQAVADAGGDPSGYPTPKWNLTQTQSIMKAVGTETVIFSLTAPGACIVNGTASRELARKANEYSAQMKDSDPSRYGFFASLPDLFDTEGALEEIRYSMDVLKADGITLFSRYGDGPYYLGRPEFKPVWEELNRRSAVVFIHPTHPVDTRPINPAFPILAQPLLDYPHETTRTAVDMILSNTKKSNPNVKVILSHAGGTLPYLLTRMTVPLRGVPPELSSSPKTSAEIREEAQSFFYDLAVSSSHFVLKALLDFVPPTQILYGSDNPYLPAMAVTNFDDDLESFQLPRSTRELIYYKNAQSLIPRLRKVKYH